MKPNLLALTLLLVPAVVTAAEGEPIAIRFWEDYSVSIESHSGLNLEIEPGSALSDIKPPEHRVDQTIKAKSELDHLLSRKANEKAFSFAKLDAGQSIPPNGIRVRSEHPSENEDAHGLRIELDGVTIAVPASLGTKSSASRWEVDPADVLLIPMLEDGKALSSPVLLAYFKALNPKRVVVSAEYPPQDLKVFQSAIGLATEPLTIEHNTFALSAGGLSRETAPQVVAVSDTPHELSETLETLFQAMEKSNLKSQQVFGKLSAKQLNFRPSNGTHTPRWNSEHMMGRQLGFFSQIFHAIDPAIPVMNLNPKQMPKDYVAAHPDWDGMEEARQMQRVSEFTRRFAYLLEGIDLNKRAPGSGWTLGALLRQMERHYDGHTANTVKKFSLPDWPSE